MKKILNNITIYIYVFIIFTSTLPSKENYLKISNLKYVFPEIKEMTKENDNNTDIEYSFKLFEIFKNIF